MWFLCITAFAADFSEIEPGVSLEGGQRVGVSSLGVSFELPDGWQGTLPRGSEVLVLTPSDGSGVVLAIAEEATIEEAGAYLTQPVPLDNLVLTPASSAEVRGDRVVVTYTGSAPGGAARGHAEAIRGDNGTAIAFLATGEGDLPARVQGLLDSVRFHTAPKPAAPAPPSGKWAGQLSGKQLLYMKTENGFSQEKRLTLCPDGSAWWNARDNYLSGGFSGSAAGDGGGRWTTRGDALQIAWNDGTTSSWTLSLQGERFAMDGDVHWFIEGEARCGP